MLEEQGLCGVVLLFLIRFWVRPWGAKGAGTLWGGGSVPHRALGDPWVLGTGTPPSGGSAGHWSTRCHNSPVWGDSRVSLIPHPRGGFRDLTWGSHYHLLPIFPCPVPAVPLRFWGPLLHKSPNFWKYGGGGTRKIMRIMLGLIPPKMCFKNKVKWGQVRHKDEPGVTGTGNASN